MSRVQIPSPALFVASIPGSGRRPAGATRRVPDTPKSPRCDAAKWCSDGMLRTASWFLPIEWQSSRIVPLVRGVHAMLGRDRVLLVHADAHPESAVATDPVSLADWCVV